MELRCNTVRPAGGKLLVSCISHSGVNLMRKVGGMQRSNGYVGGGGGGKMC